MFDSIVATSIPSRMVRFGKCWHGLVKTFATKDPVFTQYVAQYASAELVTGGGMTLPFIFKGYSSSASWQTDIKFGPMCIYMHPMAAMQTEDLSGKDWSGYVVFDIKNTQPSYFVGLAEGVFAFTPDDQGQGSIVSSVTGSAIDTKKLLLSSMTDFISITRKQYGFDIGAPFHISKSGRTVYGGRFPTPLEIMENMHFPNWATLYAPKISSAELSGYIDELTIARITATQVALPDPPIGVYSTDYRDNKTYVSVGIWFPTLGVCADPSLDLAGSDRQSGLSEPIHGYASEIESLDQYSLESKQTSILAHVNDIGEISYLTFRFIEESGSSGSGDVNGYATASLGSDQCGVREGDRRVIGTTAGFSGYASRTGFSSTKIQLEGWSGVSSFDMRFDNSFSSSYSSDAVDNDPPVESSSSESSSVLSVTLDGVTIYTGENISVNFSILGVIPTAPDLHCVADGGVIFRFDGTDGAVEDGTKWVRIVAGLADYQSNDIRAIYTTIQTGTIKMVGGVAQSDPLTYTCNLYIGKAFGRGVSDDYTHSQGFYEDAYLSRAYDPLNTSLSVVYPYPVFYQ